jgi:fructokinase
MGFRIVGIGEVLWDLLETGPQLGGAPANFAYHAHALGGEAHVITRIGSDQLGDEILVRFRDMGLHHGAVQVDDQAATGTASVALSRDGIAHFEVQENVAWDHIAASSAARACVSEADAVCFGSLAQRSEVSRNTIQQLVSSSPAHALRVFDVNLRRPFFTREIVEQSLRLANILKLNDDELPTLAEMFDLSGATKDRLQQLAGRFNLNSIALTRGSAGALLYQKLDGNPRWSDRVTSPVQIADTVGAGDSFTAAMVLGLLSKMDLDEINSIANEVARYVCSQSGATPVLPPEFGKQFQQPTHPAGRPIKQIS